MDHFAVGLNLKGTRRNGKVRGGIKLGGIPHLDRGLDQLSGSGDVCCLVGFNSKPNVNSLVSWFIAATVPSLPLRFINYL